MRRAAEIALSLGSHHAAVLACLLPRSERRRLAFALDLDLRPANLELGIIEFLGGAICGSLAFLRHAESLSHMETSTVAMQIEPNVALSTLILAGPLTFFSFIFTLVGAITFYVTLAGFLRLVVQTVTSEVSGDPAVGLAVLGARGISRRTSAWRERRVYGPERPDRFLVEPGSDLVVLSSREKPGWNERVTIRVGDRFYRLAAVEEREDGPHRSRAYILRETEVREVVRGLIVLDPPSLPRSVEDPS